jgi:hypothetical protein
MPFDEVEVTRRVRTMFAVETARRGADAGELDNARRQAHGASGFTELGRWIGESAGSRDAAVFMTEHVVRPAVREHYAAHVAAGLVKANTVDSSMHRLRAARDAVLDARGATGTPPPPVGPATSAASTSALAVPAAPLVALDDRAAALVLGTRQLLQAVNDAHLDRMLADIPQEQDLSALMAAQRHLTAAAVSLHQAAAVLRSRSTGTTAARSSDAAGLPGVVEDREDRVLDALAAVALSEHELVRQRPETAASTLVVSAAADGLLTGGEALGLEQRPLTSGAGQSPAGTPTVAVAVDKHCIAEPAGGGIVRRSARVQRKGKEQIGGRGS